MTFDASLAETVRTFQALGTIKPEIEKAGRLIVDTLKSGGKLLIGGNGGSSAEAAHFATELVGRYAKTRRPLPAVALSSDGSLVTCLHEAKKLGLSSIAFLGRGGGKTKGLATVDLVIPGASGAAAQEAHLFLIHHFCELIDEAF